MRIRFFFVLLLWLSLGPPLRAQPSPALPDWVQAWIAADAMRPWPPQVPPDVEAGWTG